MKLTKLALLLYCSLLSVACGEQSKPKIEQQPNVLFILVDDLGLKDLSFTGSQFYETPHIDGMARESMVFDQGYAASRVCSPSRASIMSGKFTARHGITDWIGAKSGEAWREANRHDKLLPAAYVHALPAADISLAEAMKAAGYKTFYAGKWHLGAEGSYPEDHGFDINKGGWDKGSPIGGYYSPWKNPKLENKEPGENLSMRLAEETAAFIKQHRDSSFFAFLSFYAVHGPIQTTQEKWGKYRDKANEAIPVKEGYIMERNLPIRQVQDNPIYAGLVESMDDAVGLVLQTLKEQGLEENTMVIFTSDNGGVASGDSFSTANLPLRGGKGYQWEGGIREPYFIKVPWMATAGKRTDYPVTGTDFYPTILDLAAIDLQPRQHIDGVSLKPLLEGNSLEPRPLYWHYPHYGNQGGDPSSIIREGDLKLIHYWEDGSNELYDLKQDPSEQNDISNSHEDKVADLYKKLNNWLTQVNANMPAPDPEYDAKLDKERDERIRSEVWSNLEKQRHQVLSSDFEPNEDWWGSKITED